MDIAALIASHNTKSEAAIPDDVWAKLVARARELCASWAIDPRSIAYIHGPDEWGIVKGQYALGTWQRQEYGAFNYTPIEDAELRALVAIIDAEAAELDALWAPACAECDDAGAFLEGNGDRRPCAACYQAPGVVDE